MNVRDKVFVGVVCVLLLTAACSFIPIGRSDGKFTDANVLSGLSSNTVSVQYSFEKPTIRTVQYGATSYDEIIMPNVLSYGKPGAPQLPAQGVFILLPEGAMVDSIDVTVGEKRLVETGKMILPGVEDVPYSSTGLPPLPIPDNEIYQSSEPFPHERFLYQGIQWFRGRAIVTGALYPVEYLPVSGSVSYYADMIVTITLAKTATGNELLRGLEKDRDAVAEKVENPTAAYETFDGPAFESTVKNAYDLLIITNQSLKPGFQRLVNYHTANGIRTIIKTVGGDIPLGATVNQTCDNIRTFIRQMYKQTGIEYVLLGGDIAGVPAPYLLRDIPSDLYYGCLDGSYNSNGDEIWGQPTDGENGGDVDLFAEVYVGRACVDNLSDVGHFVNKTIRYLQTADTTSYLRNVTMAGQNLFPGWGGDYLDQIVPLIPEDEYDVTRLYDRDYPGHNWPVTVLINLMNNGTHLINHLGHSGSFYNMKFDFRDHTLELINNTDKLFFVYSQGCWAGAFDKDWISDEIVYLDCMAEHFTVKTETRAFAGIWNTRDGYPGPSNNYHYEFIDAIFNEGKSVISVANQDSKEENVHLINDGVFRYCYYEITYFGDPTLAFQNRPFQADAHGPYTALVNQTVQLKGSAYSGAPPYSFSWEFGDGVKGKGRTSYHVFKNPGLYIVNLTVKDRQGNRVCNSTTVRIIPKYVWVDDNFTQATPGWGIIRFNKIQDGINAVNIGGTVFVFNGTYNEHISIYKTILLIGESANSTMVTWNGGHDVLTLFADNATIHGFTLINRVSNHAGIAGISNNSIITQNNITTINYNTDYGIDLSYSSNNTILGNTISNYSTGILLTNCMNTTIEANTVHDDNNVGIDLVGTRYTTISNNIIQRCPTGIAVYLQRRHHDEPSNNNTIIDNSITDSFWTSIALEGSEIAPSSDNTIMNNTCFSDDGSSISLQYAHRNILVGNICFSARSNDIILSSSWHNRLHRNTMINSGLVIEGDRDTFTTQEISFDNIVNGKPIYYYKNRNMNNVSVPSDAGEVVVGNCSWLTISDLCFEDTSIGVAVGYSSHISVLKSTFSRNTLYGVSLQYAEFCVISQNDFLSNPNFGVETINSLHNVFSENFFDDNFLGISLASSYESVLSGNMINGSQYSGIDLDKSTDIIVTANRITNCSFSGICLSGSDNNIISDNSINNTGYGIMLGFSWSAWSSSDENLLSGNRITMNEEGIILRDATNNTVVENTITDNAVGVDVLSSFLIPAIDNIVYHNNFLRNELSASDYYNNLWNSVYPSGGNYWDDYTGVDYLSGPDQTIPGSDGIGDVPYDIVGGASHDYYPFMIQDGWRQ